MGKVADFLPTYQIHYFMFNEDYFNRLTKRKILLDDLSQDEQRDYEAMLLNYPEARLMLDSLTEMYHDQEFLAKLKDIDKAKELTIVFDKARANIRKRMLRYVGTAAIVIFIIATAAAYYFPNLFRHKLRSEDRITLLTSEGKSIDLEDKRNRSFHVSGALFSADSSGLRILPTENDSCFAKNTLVVPKGKTYHVVLEDGTEVFLNADSRLGIPSKFNARSRQAALTGEAYFKVVRDGRPFLVTINAGTVKVECASFNINTYDSGNAVISLVEGPLTFLAPDRSLDIGQGTELLYLPLGLSQIRPCNLQTATAWQKGYYLFHNKTLSAIAVMLERIYNVPVIAVEKSPNAQPMTGVINKKKSIEENIRNLQNLIPIRYFSQNDTLHLCAGI